MEFRKISGTKPFMTDSKSTGSSIYGSSDSNKEKQAQELDSDSSSSLSVEDKNFKSIGSKKFVCYSESENKAHKLNRTEECRLESYRKIVQKQQDINQKNHLKNFRVFRAKSAKLFGVSEDNWSDRMSTEGKRPKTSGNNLKHKFSRQVTTYSDISSKSECEKCNEMQGLISSYEKEINKSHVKFRDIETDSCIESHDSHHTTCLFSDRQLKTFMHLLETKYIKDLPNRTNEYRASHKYTKAEKMNGTHGSTPVLQNKVKEFCKRQQEFNKLHSVPASIKIGLEEIRIQEAMMSNLKTK